MCSDVFVFWLLRCIALCWWFAGSCIVLGSRCLNARCDALGGICLLRAVRLSACLGFAVC